MSEYNIPLSPNKVDFIDTPPTSPCDHEAIILSHSPLVIRNSSPEKFKRKVASVLASLYDEEPTPKRKTKSEEVVTLASSIWNDAAPQVIPGNEPEVEENKEALEKPGVDRIKVVDGYPAKEWSPSLDSTDIESPEKTAEVLSMAFTEPELTEAMISSSINPDTASSTISIDPIEAIHSASCPAATEVSQMEYIPSTIEGDAEKFEIRHEWTGTCEFDLITEKSIELQKKASFTQNVKCGN